MHEPIAYVYDADVHCPDCALEAFGRGADGFIGTDSTDSEGNDIGVIAPWDATQPEGEYCGDCGGCIVEPWEDDSED